MIMMYQCKFMNCNKRSTLMEEVDIEEAVHVGGIGSIWEISVPSVSFCCEPKTALKKNPNPKNITNKVLIFRLFFKIF